MVELLIVISLIGILSGLILTIIQPGKLRADARDAQRLSDLRVLQGALELYFADNRSYPKTCTGATCTPAWVRIVGIVENSSDYISRALVPAYMSEIKLDPLQVGTQTSPCWYGTPTSYRYNYWSDGSIYYLTAIMESSENTDQPCNPTIPISLFSTSCTSHTANTCTVVRNP